MHFSQNRHLPILATCAAGLLASCSAQRYAKDTPPSSVVRDGVAITLSDQKLTVIQKGKKVKDYDISSSKFGIGSSYGSKKTPTGIHAVTRKVGEGQPIGMVFKGCRPTGEVVPVNAAGRDPIVTRIIQLAGLEPQNRNSHVRRIYIHGTAEERTIGTPASYGCIRMRSRDVLDLYQRVYRGMPVAIETCSQKTYLAAESNTRRVNIPQAVVNNLPRETQASPRAKRWVSRSHRSKRLAATHGKNRYQNSKNVKRKRLVSKSGKARSAKKRRA